MNRSFFFHANRVLLAAVLSAAGTGALAQSSSDFARVDTYAQNAPYFSAKQVLAGCSSSLRGGNPSESTGLTTCSADATGRLAAVTVEASVQAPKPTQGFQPPSELRTYARIDVDTANRAQLAEVTAGAFARFRDYMNVGPVRPDHIVIDFTLSGRLDLRNVLPSFQGTNELSFAETSVRGSAYGGANATEVNQTGLPDGQGESEVTFRLVPGELLYRDALGNPVYGNPQSRQTRFDHPNNTTGRSGFNLINSSAPDAGHFQLYLGESFFYTNRVLIEFGLSSLVQLYVGSPIAGLPYFAESDFAHTLTMTDLRAFDANDNDITSAAFAGFESARLVSGVPEPATAVLLAAGLFGLGAAHRRRVPAPAAIRS